MCCVRFTNRWYDVPIWHVFSYQDCSNTPRNVSTAMPKECKHAYEFIHAIKNKGGVKLCIHLRILNTRCIEFFNQKLHVELDTLDSFDFCTPTSRLHTNALNPIPLSNDQWASKKRWSVFPPWRLAKPERNKQHVKHSHMQISAQSFKPTPLNPKVSRAVLQGRNEIPYYEYKVLTTFGQSFGFPKRSFTK